MELSNLPLLELVGVSDDQKSIEDYLISIFGNGNSISHISVVHGERRSGRILLQKRSIDSVPLPRPVSAEKIAIEMLRLAKEEARYDPAVRPKHHKGWEIKRAVIDSSPVAILLAQWV